MPTFVYAQSEVNPHNTDGEVLFGYFEGDDPPTNEQLDLLQRKQNEYRSASRLGKKLDIVHCLGWAEVIYDQTYYPNELSERAKLKRYIIGELG